MKPFIIFGTLLIVYAIWPAPWVIMTTGVAVVGVGLFLALVAK